MLIRNVNKSRVSYRTSDVHKKLWDAIKSGRFIQFFFLFVVFCNSYYGVSSMFMRMACESEKIPLFMIDEVL